MPRFLAPLLQAATYARWLHLMTGTVFVAVVLLVYPGTETGRPLWWVVAVSAALDSALLGLAALLPATRRAEGVLAGLLLAPGREETIGVAPSAGWRDRGRTAGWLVARVGLGFAAGLATVRGLTTAVDLLTAPPWGPLLVPPFCLALLWLIVLAGRLQLALAVRLLGPSAADRLAAAELRAERLLERNRLARELHDSIGHALTVTVLQAGAAREVADPAFREKALEAIETTGRQAMEDLERMLVLLRETPDGAAAERPGLDRVPALFDAARAAGSPVEAAVDPALAARLPGVVSREAYRIVQEGVTNALKHAPGTPIRVRAAVDAGRLDLHCATALPADGHRQGRTGRGGRGLRGVRERAVLLGGAAEAGRRDGDWVLSVSLPVRLAE
ncbi:histidine kinase [Kitasatospora sp. NPDC085895]|uniref:sensor histidine kinase n=1 Tax=Kitasatospora sp. NPDC085895 TaxID=3155057 RepID=UPI00344C1AC2